MANYPVHSKSAGAVAARPHQVVIVGCGFGGLFAARRLRRAAVEITVIDRVNHHLFQPLLYQLAKGMLSQGDIAPPIRHVLRHQRNTGVVLGEVVDIDLDTRQVIVDTMGEDTWIAYDSLIVATGASQLYFGHPEFANDAPEMKTIDHALEEASTILPACPNVLRERAARDLRDMGVESHAGTRVDELGVDTNAKESHVRRIEPATKIWAAGVEASPLGRILAQASGVELDRAGRVKVEPDCTLRGHPEVFVIGDLMSLDQLPPVAQVAIQSAGHAAHTIIRRLAGDTTRRPFRYRELGTMATISRLRAIAVLARLHVSGFPAWVVWLLIHLMTLTGFKNRISVAFNWTAAFLGRGRPERVITAQQVFARHALEVTRACARECAADINGRRCQGARL